MKHSQTREAGLEPCSVASSTWSAHPSLTPSGPKALHRDMMEPAAPSAVPCLCGRSPCTWKVKCFGFQPHLQCLLLVLLCRAQSTWLTTDRHCISPTCAACSSSCWARDLKRSLWLTSTRSMACSPSSPPSAAC